MRPPAQMLLGESALGAQQRRYRRRIDNRRLHALDAGGQGAIGDLARRL